jgi:serine protease inhibitor
MKNSIGLLVALALTLCLVSFGPASFAAKDSAVARNSSGETSCHLTNQRLLSMRSAVGSSTAFGLKLFNVIPRKTDENLLVSPFSAYTALSMTLNGAGSTTREQMAGVLGVNSKLIDDLNTRNQNLIAALNDNKTVQMEIANALYADRSTPLEASFTDLCRKIYGAEARCEDFAAASTLKAINDWCKSKTHGKIASILDRLDPSMRMVLLNAIYFKGAWQDQFMELASRDDKFTTGSGRVVPVKMMNQEEHCLYYKGSNFAAAALPYVGRKQSMYIFLPDKGVDIKTFQSELTLANWMQWLQSFRTSRVDVSLPKFKMDYSRTLNDILSAMGMPDAFVSGKADFSRMMKAPTWIDLVLQKTYIDVNEKGTEAAAVTAVCLGGGMAPVSEPLVKFRVDRPFVFAIVDDRSQEILFIGTIAKP